MRQICMDCGMLYGVKLPIEDDRETHGFCDNCFDKITKNITLWEEEEEKKDEALQVGKTNRKD